VIPRLMSLQQWRRERFAGRIPSENTVKRWAKNGDIPAKKIGKTWFVLVQEEIGTTGDELVDRILKGS